MDPLVSTKVRPSQSRPVLVARPHLIEELDPEAGRRLTLVSAPAGFGKTTLVGEWSEERADEGHRVAWLSLDGGDNDPVRFLFYLVASLRRGTGEERFGEAILSAFRSPEPPRIEALTAAFVNEVAAIPGGLDLVLDDYHLIDSEDVHRIVSFVLERLPKGAHLVVSGRANPPLPLARLRARGQMAELGAAELAFTEDEAGAFLKGVMGLDLSVEDIAKLEGRTEGWIAGLQLAALSMRDRKDSSGFVEMFSGSHRDVLDFLAEEVLESQPEAAKEFLLSTSVLDRMSAPLCDALTGRSDGQAMLERLERNNLFVVALDDERRWYRYHHLFADFLRGRLGQENPELAAELNRRAAEWYEQAGWFSAAIGHALAAADHERAARLVERTAMEAWSGGEAPTLRGWIEALPDEVVRRRPHLRLHHATTLLFTGANLRGVEDALDDAERAFNTGETLREADETERRSVLGGVATVRGWLARLEGKPDLAIELSRRAQGLLPEDETMLRAFAAFCLGEASRYADDLQRAGEAFSEAVGISRAADNPSVALGALSHLAGVRAEQGRLREMEAILDEALRLAEGRDVGFAAGSVLVGMGHLHYERNALDAAERELTEGIRLVEPTAEIGTLVEAYVTLARLKSAKGDGEGALEAIRRADRVARNSSVSEAKARAASWMVRLRIARGDFEAAALWEERVVNPGEGAGSARISEGITQARLLLARGEREEALGLLHRLRREAEAAGRRGTVIETLTLEALALWSKNEKERAVGALAQALSLAEPEGYVRTFVDEGPPMADLLTAVLEARRRGHLDYPARYLAGLLAALAWDASAPDAGESRPEPLSEREAEVLALISAGRSNQEIAEELFVTLSTVKSHANSLFGKLGVRNRTQAVARAREMNLL